MKQHPAVPTGSMSLLFLLDLVLGGVAGDMLRGPALQPENLDGVSALYPRSGDT